VEILICTDGSKTSIQSAELVTKFRFIATTRIIILGVSESKADVKDLSTAMDLIEKSLSNRYALSRKMRYGDPIEEILAEALEGSYDLVVVGGGGTQLGLLHPQIGSTTSKLARKLHTHFLIARNIPKQIGKILICSGADAPASETMRLGGEWISKTTAQVGLLHVIPISKKTAEIQNGRQQPHDLLIEQAKKQLRDAGVNNEIVSRIRNGLVVEEVLQELMDEGYELLVVGSHYQPGQDHWQETLLDDITDQLINRSTCSVLII
jgi:nucleotide-binding universal stress UspA family protein